MKLWFRGNKEFTFTHQSSQGTENSLVPCHLEWPSVISINGKAHRELRTHDGLLEIA